METGTLDRDDSAEHAAWKDGSLTLHLQHAPPPAGTANWLPTPAGPMMFVLRLYEPAEAVLEGRYRLPRIEVVGDDAQTAQSRGREK